MKKMFPFLSLLTLLLSVGTTSIAQEALSQKEIDDLSYSYGAMISKTITEIELSTNERNSEKFIEGVKNGFSCDSTTLADAQIAFYTRLTGTASGDEKEEQQFAYTMGLAVMGSLVADLDLASTDFNLTSIQQGFVDAQSELEFKYTEEEMNTILKNYFDPKNEIFEKKEEAKKLAEASDVIEAGKVFLAENAKRKGVVSMENGMQYEELKKGKGKKPTAWDNVKTRYQATLIDGTVFDSATGTGVTFSLEDVIEGWQIGIPLMSVGAKYRFYIPQELAYGLESHPEIPSGSTLIFEVELLDINPKK